MGPGLVQQPAADSRHMGLLHAVPHPAVLPRPEMVLHRYLGGYGGVRGNLSGRSPHSSADPQIRTARPSHKFTILPHVPLTACSPTPQAVSPRIAKRTARAPWPDTCSSRCSTLVRKGRGGAITGGEDRTRSLARYMLESVLNLGARGRALRGEVLHPFRGWPFIGKGHKVPMSVNVGGATLLAFHIIPSHPQLCPLYSHPQAPPSSTLLAFQTIPPFHPRHCPLHSTRRPHLHKGRAALLNTQ